MIGTRFMFALVCALTLLSVGAYAGAYANSVTYTGQGLIADDFGGYDLQTEFCGVENGADVDGPYLLWVLMRAKPKTQISQARGERPR